MPTGRGAAEKGEGSANARASEEVIGVTERVSKEQPGIINKV